ncbi:SpoIID/LytB domain-containing protein [Nocardioides sp. GXQ0305]|uniref:SpoIID/LytB domain-containing protein n=1 Tax=Nocardioides sp. GXQ0305 TaxID=3423912 RepID=UPI003D7D95A8
MRPLGPVLAPALGTAVGTVVAVVATSLAASPASAADSWDVPRSASLTVKGHGYGHGRGMSQYGAEGAAREGLGWRQITDFYYPGTSRGRVGGRIRVHVSADTTDDLVVVPRSGLTVTDLGTDTTLTLPDRDTHRWRVVRSGSGHRVQWQRGTRWRTWRTLSGNGVFAASGEPVRLVTPGGARAYRGTLTAVPLSGGRVTVNTVNLESYLRGVVPLEMPALWSPAAVRAQAVAARTYAAYERAHPRSSAFDVYDTTASQVYGGVGAEHSASDAAIRATRRRILEHDGAAAFTQFSSSNGGWSVRGSVPYQRARRDPYDDWSGNPVHAWSVTVSDATFERAWPALGNLRRIRVVGRDGNGEWGGRVTRMRLVGSRSSVSVSGDTMRSALGLRSTWVTFRVR